MKSRMKKENFYWTKAKVAYKTISCKLFTKSVVSIEIIITFAKS